MEPNARERNAASCSEPRKPKSRAVSAHRSARPMFVGDVRCATRVYERFSWLGNNRLSLSVTVFGRDGDIQLSAVSSGGSQAMFFKINTWGEEAFLDKFRSQLDAYLTGSVDG